MDRDVKPRRTYDGAARQARTRRTQAAVVEAAQSLFVERGYAATTIDAMSERSDTPPTTVYRLFSSKLGILKAMLDVSIGGDDRAMPMADRPQVRALLSDADPANQLTGFAALLAEIARQRHEGQQGIARSLARSGALRPGLGERDAADVIHALASPEVYGLLVTDRGWSGERYETWLRSILTDQLLP